MLQRKVSHESIADSFGCSERTVRQIKADRVTTKKQATKAGAGSKKISRQGDFPEVRERHTPLETLRFFFFFFTHAIRAPPAFFVFVFSDFFFTFFFSVMSRSFFRVVLFIVLSMPTKETAVTYGPFNVFFCFSLFKALLELFVLLLMCN